MILQCIPQERLIVLIQRTLLNARDKSTFNRGGRYSLSLYAKTRTREVQDQVLKCLFYANSYAKVFVRVWTSPSQNSEIPQKLACTLRTANSSKADIHEPDTVCTLGTRNFGRTDLYSFVSPTPNSTTMFQYDFEHLVARSPKCHRNWCVELVPGVSLARDFRVLTAIRISLIKERGQDNTYSRNNDVMATTTTTMMSTTTTATTTTSPTTQQQRQRNNDNNNTFLVMSTFQRRHCCKSSWYGVIG